jgi:crotonobetainyl-CoA:carnitine CoA-transferase CaiB-like acyl-CoA transferase
MVMRYLDETDDVPTRIVKVIGDMCGILTYTMMVLYAVMH